MVETLKDYEIFLSENKKDDLFLHIIYEDDRFHSVCSTPSIIFIQNFKTEKIYSFCINHQDGINIVPLKTILEDVNKFSGRIFVLDKKSLIQHFPINSCIDINLGIHLNGDDIINLNEFETTSHKFFKQNFYIYPSINKVVPLVKHQEMVSNIFFKIKTLYKSLIFNEKYFFKINSSIIEPLSELECNGIFVDKYKFKKRFNIDVDNNGLVFSKYNLYTSTGRPSNSFGGVNYAALNKDDGSRSCFVSRFRKDGIMVLIDYSSFHPRIICELTNFNLPLDVDFYSYIAKLCFKKREIDINDINDAKSLTFRQLFGGVEQEYSHIQFFYNLKGFIDFHWKEFNERGYTTTPLFGRKFFKNQIHDANPPKLFNYILQSTETEIAVPILGKVCKFLKQIKSKAVLYTYDSILFDVHIDELNIIKNDVVDLMKNENRFPIKCYIGNSYADLKQVST